MLLFFSAKGTGTLGKEIPFDPNSSETYDFPIGASDITAEQETRVREAAMWQTSCILLVVI